MRDRTFGSMRESSSRSRRWMLDRCVGRRRDDCRRRPARPASRMPIESGNLPRCPRRRRNRKKYFRPFTRHWGVRRRCSKLVYACRRSNRVIDSDVGGVVAASNAKSRQSRSTACFPGFHGNHGVHFIRTFRRLDVPHEKYTLVVFPWARKGGGGRFVAVREPLVSPQKFVDTRFGQ